MYVVVASDHAGFDYKTLLIPVLMASGFKPVDLGAYDTKASDYPDHAAAVAGAILAGQAEKGIIICGSGVGVSIAANKFKGIRAGVCHDTYSAHQSVEHDNANVLCIGERIIGTALMYEICIAFLQASFSAEERHVKRLDKVKQIEDANFK
ncbi:MAG: ribose 5-phosphate isomerase B [Ferruginibacter sp.]